MRHFNHFCGVCVCPKIGVSYFQKTSTLVFGTYNETVLVPFFKLGSSIRCHVDFPYKTQKIESGLRMIYSGLVFLQPNERTNER